MFTKNHLKALLEVAPKNDARYYLNGAYIEAGPETGTIRATATSGKVLISFTVPSDVPHCALPIIVPREALERAAKAQESYLSANGGVWSLGTVPFKPIDGRFPEWRNVIPSIHESDRAAPVPLDPDLVISVMKAVRFLGYDKRWFTGPFGTSDGRFAIVPLPSGVAIIMALQSKKTSDSLRDAAIAALRDARK